MRNKLFITCPFSCIEFMLQQKYGNDIFFISSSGAVLQHEESLYMKAVKDIILKEDIKTIYFVNDISCRLINSIIKKERFSGLYSEEVLSKIYREYYSSYFKRQTLSKQQTKLAELNIKKQMNKMIRSPLLSNYIEEKEIEVKGLVTIKAKNVFKEIVLCNLDNNLHEL